jgi:hypothetical protein
MLLHLTDISFKSSRDLAEWMNRKHRTLATCYNENSNLLLKNLKTISQIMPSFTDLNLISISRCLRGLAGLTELPEVQLICDALASIINKSTFIFTSEAIESSFLGLQKMEAESTAIQTLLAALALKIKQTGNTLSSRSMSMALYSLQNMKAEHQSVQNVLHELNEKINLSNKPFKEKDISMSLYGFKCMDSSVEIVGETLLTLAKKVKSSRFDNFVEMDVAMMLSGLQHMEITCPGVILLLETLVKSIKYKQFNFNARQVSMALYGFQKMSANSKAEQSVLKALAKKSDELQAPLTPQAISNAIFGIKALSTDIPSVLSVLEQLNKKKPEKLSRKDDFFLWAQFAAGLIILAENNNNNQLILGLLPKPFNASMPIDKIKDSFGELLAAKQINEGRVDLHGLDHVSAQMLLKHIAANSKDLHSIIFGKSGHSKPRQREAMRMMVEDWIKTHPSLMHIKWKDGCVSFKEESPQYRSDKALSTRKRFFSPDAGSVAPDRKRRKIDNEFDSDDRSSNFSKQQ